MIVEQLPQIDSRFIDFYRALCLLRCVSMLERGHSCNVFADLIVLATCEPRVLDLSCINKFSTNTSVSAGCKRCQLSFSLMSTLRLATNRKLLNELLKVHLHYSLECDNHCAFHELKNCFMNIYLACLYCSSEQYRTAVKHCVTAISSMQGCNNVSCIERQLLPQFDDNIERVLGIILFCQFVLNSSLNQVQQAECSYVYSANLLAHYLTAMCLKQEHTDSEFQLQNEFGINEKRLHDNGITSITDTIQIKKLVWRRSQYKSASGALQRTWLKKREHEHKTIKINVD